MKRNYYLAAIGGALSLSLASLGFAGQEAKTEQQQGSMQESTSQDTQASSQNGDMGSKEARGQSVDSAMQNQSSTKSLNPKLIRQAQQKLNAGGYNAGPEDGIWGRRTQAALEEFQRDHGIEANGQLDQKTLAVLDIEDRGGVVGAAGTAGGEGEQGTSTGVGATDADDDDAATGAAGSAPSSETTKQQGESQEQSR